MNNTARITAAIFAASLAFTGTAALAQDKAKPAAPAKDAKAPAKDQRVTKVIVENEKVRVTETTYPPGNSSGMQERGPRVVRALTDGTLEKVFPDGKKETVTWKAGQVRFNPKETYDQKNVGNTTVTLYVVNLK